MNELTLYEDLVRLSGLKIQRIEPKERRIDIYGEVDEGVQACPTCGHPTDIVRQYTTREIRDLDISGRHVWLHLSMKQYECSSCNRYFTQRLSWADSGKSYTKRQAKFIFEMCEYQPYTQVGAIADMNAKCVERLYLDYAAKHCQVADRLREVRRLGIDELSHRKGKKSYCCVLTDLDRGVHLDILPNRKKETLQAYFQQLGPNWCAQIQAVSCDMWSPYTEVAEEFFPQADICIDRFHVVVQLNQVLDRFRKYLRRTYPNNKLYKHIKWLLFKRSEKLSEQELHLLALALAENEELAQMYELRNAFHYIFDYSQPHRTALVALEEWIEAVDTSTTSQHWVPFLNTLNNWKRYILNYIHTGLTNAATEGLNNIIRYVKRISFGMHNFEHLRLRVLSRMH